MVSMTTARGRDAGKLMAVVSNEERERVPGAGGAVTKVANRREGKEQPPRRLLEDRESLEWEHS